jgi:hypothetical protein
MAALTDPQVVMAALDPNLRTGGFTDFGAAPAP